jgi:hypothetical protein
MAKNDDAPGITLSHEQFERLLAAVASGGGGGGLDTAASQAVAEKHLRDLQQRDPDAVIREQLARMRGVGRPLRPEPTPIFCRSPLTGATFRVRLVATPEHPEGVATELLDYTRPEGWDRPRSEGGLFDGLREEMLSNKPGARADAWSFRYGRWVWTTFMQADQRATVDKKAPASALSQWVVPAPAAAPAAAE